MRLKEVLREKGMSAKELASKMGISETGLSLALKNSSFSLIRLREIAEAIPCNMTELLYDEDTQEHMEFVFVGKAGDEFFMATSLAQLKEVVKRIECKL